MLSKVEALARLRTLLTELHQTSQDAQRVSVDAGLNLAFINLNESLINLWHNILIQADIQERVEAIVNITIDQYPTWTEKLRSAYEIYMTIKKGETKQETKRPEVDFYHVKTSLASILKISFDEISLLKKMPHGWQVEMPPDAADRLVLLSANDASQLHSLGIRSIKMINRPTSSSISSGTHVTKDAHTFQITLEGKAIQGITNHLALLINNTSSLDYRQVRIHLQTVHHLIDIDPTTFRLADLKKNSSRSLPLKIHASQAGSYEIQVRANSIPAPEEGFLRPTTLQVFIESTPPKCVLLIELI